MQCRLRFVSMTHIRSGADDAIAQALADEVGKQSTGLDFALLAESAMDAVLHYEDQMNDQYVREHPECVDESLSDFRSQVAQKIRSLRCPYVGTEGIAFREARDKAARIVETG